MMKPLSCIGLTVMDQAIISRVLTSSFIFIQTEVSTLQVELPVRVISRILVSLSNLSLRIWE